MPNVDSLLARLREELPPVVSRHEAPRLLGGIVSSGTLANADSAGTGPDGLFYVGRRAVYEREAFLEWLRSRLTTGRRRGAVGVETKADGRG